VKKRLFQIIFEHDTKAGKRFDILLLWLILASVFVVILESIPDARIYFYNLFYGIEWFFTIIFSLEYILRVWCSPKPIKYIFSMWGLVDLVSIIPTYFEFFLPGYHYFLTVRIFRLLRVFRILKLVRFNREAQLLQEAIVASLYKISVFFMTVITIVVLLGTVMYVVEGEENGFTSIPQSIYWAIVTLTTVGFGDIVPATVLGKFLASFAMILGYAIIAVPTGIITVELSKSKSDVKNCSSCDSSVSESDCFCRKCGNKISN
jgi:voltage-gated potassium channel